MAIEVIDGRSLAEEINAETKSNVESLKLVGVTPCLAVVIVGTNESSRQYVVQKERLAQRLGINLKVIDLPESVGYDALLSRVGLLSRSNQYHGVLIQLPLPEFLDPGPVIQKVDPQMDVDGFHPDNLRSLLRGRSEFIPVFPQAMMLMAKKGIGTIKDKNVLICAKSGPFATVLEHLCWQEGAGVVDPLTSSRGNIPAWRKYDLILTAQGEPDSVPLFACRDGVVVIDGGVTVVNGRSVGDLSFRLVEGGFGSYKVSKAIGGVGPVTVAMAFRNLVTLTKR